MLYGTLKHFYANDKNMNTCSTNIGYPFHHDNQIQEPRGQHSLHDPAIGERSFLNVWVIWLFFMIFTLLKAYLLVDTKLMMIIPDLATSNDEGVS